MSCVWVCVCTCACVCLSAYVPAWERDYMQVWVFELHTHTHTHFVSMFQKRPSCACVWVWSNVVVAVNACLHHLNTTQYIYTHTSHGMYCMCAQYECYSEAVQSVRCGMCLKWSSGSTLDTRISVVGKRGPAYVYVWAGGSMCVQVCAHTVCVSVCCFRSHSLVLVASFPNRTWKCLWGATSFFFNDVLLMFSFKIYSITSAWNCKQSLLVFSDSLVWSIRVLPILAGCFGSGLYGKEMSPAIINHILSQLSYVQR